MSTVNSGLRSYQQEGAQWLTRPEDGCRGKLLCFPPGFGKTRTALASVKMQLEAADPEAPRIVPVVTTALARSDWLREARTFWPEARVHILGTESNYQRKGETDEAFEQRRNAVWHSMLTERKHPSLVVLAYESLERLAQKMVELEVLPEVSILDEAHHVKKHDTNRGSTVTTIVGRTRNNILMTGTPVHNRPTDLWNLLQLSGVTRNENYWGWVRKYFMVRVKEGGFGRVVGELHDKARLAMDLAPHVFTKSIKDAYGELPARQRVLKRIEAPEAARISPAKLHKAREGSKLDAMLRDCVRHKMRAAVQLAESDVSDEPCVWYTYQRDHAEQLAEALKKAGHSCILATGELTAQKRAKEIDRWKAGEAQYLVCTMDAVRESATLTRAAAMVFLDLDWLYGRQLQCEGRIDPARQPENERRPVRYYYLVIAGGPDEVVAETLIEKVQQASGLIGKKDEEAERLAGFLSPLKTEVAQVSEAELLSSLVTRMEARYSRLTDVGLWNDDRV